ncbi:unnamed protein product [Clavelina lepadiformis]|uniref:Sulfotransferase n=1 Tax=Clavelina lepadiformis TaxID=159417 RepID=A0ABP0FRI1_CLALP
MANMLDETIRLHHVVASFIPVEVRPDVTELVEKSTSQFKSPQITEWRGYRIGPPFCASSVQWQFNNWRPTEKDVLVASYPKTGTTWLTNIVRNIIYFDHIEILEMLKSVTPIHTYIEGGTPMNFELMQKLPWNRKIWGTHLPAKLVNMKRLKENGCKVLYIIRNPNDQLLSWFKMSKTFPFNHNKVTDQFYPTEWNSFFETFVNGMQPLLSKEGEWYPDHILSYYPYRNDDNVLFVVFENLKTNTKEEIGRIAEFLGVQRTEEEINHIVQLSSFKSMKESAARFYEELKFFREGEVADWKNHFTVAQSELMDEKFNEKLSRIDIKFIYE